jgi:hypothetical protein
MYKLIKCVIQESESPDPIFRILSADDSGYEEHSYPTKEEAESARIQMSTDTVKWALYQS